MTDFHRSWALEVVRRLVDAGYQALWAGGCVRDFLLGLTPDDYDVATNATPEQVHRLFGRRQTISVGESFGVVIVLNPTDKYAQVEVATFRTDGTYSDGRRPDQIRFSSPSEDAQRRDFTLNGMFYDPLAEQVIDYVGGEQDLRAGVIRAIGNPSARIEEDKLRMLRAVRFTARFDFQLEEATAQAIRQRAEQIQVVSRERIAEELRKMLRHDSRHQALAWMEQLHLLLAIFPELEAVWSDPEFRQQTFDMWEHQNLPSFELSLAILLRSQAEPETFRNPTTSAPSVVPVANICRSLKLSNQETEAVEWLVSHQQALRGAAQLPLHQLKPLLSHPLHAELIELTHLQAVAAQTAPEDAQFCQNYLLTTPSLVINPPPILTGADLIRSGRKPSPEFSTILQAAREAQLDEVLQTHQEALVWLSQQQ